MNPTVRDLITELCMNREDQLENLSPIELTELTNEFGLSRDERIAVLILYYGPMGILDREEAIKLALGADIVEAATLAEVASLMAAKDE